MTRLSDACSLTISGFKIKNESEGAGAVCLPDNDRAKATSYKVNATRMWRLVYLFLLFVRIYLALCPSYLHPDEIFQGPEPIAGNALMFTMPLEWCQLTAYRVHLLLPESANMGMDIFPPYPQCLPSVAYLWLTDDFVKMDLGAR